MIILKRTLAVVELVLVLPAALFMVALFLREVQPLLQTGRVVEWFSQHLVLGLYVFLMGMPLAALVGGCVMVERNWRGDPVFKQAVVDTFATLRAHAESGLIAGATLMAGGILAMVALHLVTE